MEQINFWRKGLMEFSNQALAVILAERLSVNVPVGTQVGRVVHTPLPGSPVEQQMQQQPPVVPVVKPTYVCAKCGIAMTLPFVPKNNKPVFCKSCYNGGN